MAIRVKWLPYPQHKPKLSGRFFITHVEDGNRYVIIDKFLSSGMFASEFWIKNIVAFAKIELPRPAGAKND